MEFYEMSIGQAVKELDTDIEKGLDDKEAARRLLEHGKNRLAAGKKKGFLSRFLAQFNDFMIIILLCAAAVSYVTSLASGDGEIAEPIIILAIVTFNALLGTIQQMRAESSLEALKKLSSPHSNVIRNGVESRVSSEEIVPGDVIVLKAGDMVCADCRLVRCSELYADESSLTGEAAEVRKDAAYICEPFTAVGDIKNMLFSSSYIMSGEGRAVVTGTGMDTEVGKIASALMDNTTLRTPLEKRLADAGKALGVSALVICGLIFVLGTLKHIPVLEMFMTSVSLAVAAIPEGLPAIVTIMLALGVVKMSRHNAIVRTLPSVETLGCTTVICSDKTGTLTQNKMVVRDMRSRRTRRMLELCAICSESGSYANPTDRAVRDAARKHCIDLENLAQRYPIDEKLPFDSKRKMMAVRSGNLIIVKGAIEYILPLCGSCREQGRKMDSASAEKIRAANREMTGNALRVIACAYKDKNDGETIGETEHLRRGEFTFLGLIGISDPPRAEAKDAVRTCHNAGIRTVMITGDHTGTALAIARQTGIASDGDAVMTGAEIDKIDDTALRETVKTHNVYARVSPSHKSRIVKALRDNGEVVAMTGDGVNDAPALHIADIGCGMGINGTEVAKSASDIILTDDNFATIVYAVREGRAIFDNIKKAVKFLLSSNIGEILTVLFGIVFGCSAPLTAIELLWVNLVTDSLPAVALGLDLPSSDVMRRDPISPKSGIFSGGLWRTIALEGMMIGGLSLAARAIGLVIAEDEVTARTMSFFVLAVSQLVHAFNMRSETSVVKVGLLGNKFLVLSLIAGCTAQLAVVYIPAAAPIFGVMPLPPLCLAISCIMSVMPLVIVEAQKALNEKRR